MTPTGRPVPARLPLVLLGLMTLVTFAGPFLIVFAVRGGPRPEWPPDRPVEWWTFAAVTAAFAALMLACLAVAFRLHRASSREP